MEVVEMINILDNIEVLYHSCIKINKEKIIYIDPYHIDKNYNDADIIFITHDHYDHYSEEDIDKVINENTTIIIPEELLTKLLRKGINKNFFIRTQRKLESLQKDSSFLLFCKFSGILSILFFSFF